MRVMCSTWVPDLRLVRAVVLWSGLFYVHNPLGPLVALSGSCVDYVLCCLCCRLLRRVVCRFFRATLVSLSCIGFLLYGFHVVRPSFDLGFFFFLYPIGRLLVVFVTLFLTNVVLPFLVGMCTRTDCRFCVHVVEIYSPLLVVRRRGTVRGMWADLIVRFCGLVSSVFLWLWPSGLTLVSLMSCRFYIRSCRG